jgi:predicted helicase
VNGKPAVEWIIDRRRLTTDNDSGVTNKPPVMSDG